MASNLSIVELKNMTTKLYSFAVVGSGTYNHRVKLRELGGRYMKSVMSEGPGWLFPEESKEVVTAFVTENASCNSSACSSVGSTTYSTDTSMQRALMIEDLILKTRITTLTLKKVEDNTFEYETIEGSVVKLHNEEILVAEWDDGRVLIMKKGVAEIDEIEALPFLGMVNEKDPKQVMENLICYVTLNPPNAMTYYTDTLYTYAYSDQESLSKVFEELDLEA